MATIYISIVSHNNESDLIKNEELIKIGNLPNVTILLRDNVGNCQLKKFSLKNGFHYSESAIPLGFGENNNKNFSIALKHGIKPADWFITMNPDVVISCDMINKLTNILSTNSMNLFAINLFSDEKLTRSELSIRKFPSNKSLLNLIRRLPVTDAYNKAELRHLDNVDWAAGSFLIFRCSLYDELNGFDQNYFMYYEDVDICFRANNLLSEPVIYLKEIKAFHIGGYQNRNIFSKHFRWYLISLIRFLVKQTKHRLIKR
ncbi:glycosyltransferase family 2 protein [Thalassotalea crassostreae]|uniref:glycosyltransferase family 2 protein n=1 Tax=Thalassotalea crassostreae TaxID=1763536 RepID=UPI000838E853|nr:glycosyltransferase family 2 protein [Thalassotalea crassostreae]